MAKILVVDDEKLLVKGMKFNLENEGYQVECAYDGAAAVELARSSRFDLVILDVMILGDGDPHRAGHVRPGIRLHPIIMLTAKSEDADKLMSTGPAPTTTSPSANILEVKARGPGPAASGRPASGQRGQEC